MRGKLTRKRVVLLVAGAAAYVAFVMNGSYIVDRFIRPFEFGEAEMVAMLGSLNRTAEWRFTQAETGYRLQARFARKVGEDVLRASLRAPIPMRNVAHACGNRTFMQSAAACYDTTNLPVIGDITVLRERAGGSEVLQQWRGVSGYLIVLGRTLNQAEFRMTLPDGSLELRSRDAKVFELHSLHLRDRKNPVVSYYNPAAN